MAAVTTGRRIVMRAGKPPHLALTPSASLAFGWAGSFGSNVGNLVFSTAVYRHLKTPSTQIAVDGYSLESGLTDEGIARLDAEADALVIPLADAFRPAFVPQLQALSAIIERLHIPVIVIGVGGKAKLTGTASLSASEPVNAAARRFVRAVLERSESIGVRGSYTAQYLADLGIPDDRIDVVGCPSMFDLDHSGSIEKPRTLDAEGPLALTLSPYIPRIGQFLAHNAGRYPGVTYLPQRREDLRLLLWGEPAAKTPKGVPSAADDPLYRSQRMAMGVDLSVWSGFLSSQQFAFGTRIHGTIVALHAGTPAFLLAHDTRTLELAEYHEIPHLRITEGGAFDAMELFERADFTRYNAVTAERRQRYVAFLERNGLAHTLTGDRDHEYDERLGRTRFPAMVRPRLRPSRGGDRPRRNLQGRATAGPLEWRARSSHDFWSESHSWLRHLPAALSRRPAGRA